MTIENTPSTDALESMPIDVEGSGDTEALETDEIDSEALSDDPDESFESWLARQEPKDEKKSSKGVQSDESLPKSAQKDEKKTENEPKEVKKEEIKSEKIKIKDKEYSTDEIEKAFTESSEIKDKYSRLQAQVKDLNDILRTDPGQVFDKLGLNKDVIEQWYYKKFIEPDLLTPEQRQAKADHEELTLRRKQDQERQVKEESDKKEQLKQQYRQEWSKRINDALEVAGLPKSELVVSRMGYHIKQALNAGKNNAQPADVIDLVKQDLLDLQKSTITSLAPEKIIETLGEDTMAKLRKLEAEKFKQTKFENKTPSKSKPREIKKKEGKKYKNAYELLEDL